MIGSLDMTSLPSWLKREIKRQRNKKKKEKKTQIRDKHKPEEGLHTIIHT